MKKKISLKQINRQYKKKIEKAHGAPVEKHRIAEIVYQQIQLGFPHSPNIPKA